MEIIMMGSDTMTPAQARAKAIGEIKNSNEDIKVLAVA